MRKPCRLLEPLRTCERRRSNSSHVRCSSKSDCVVVAVVVRGLMDRPSMAGVLLAMEIVEDDERDDEFDSAVALAACKLLRSERNRIRGCTDEVTRRYFDFEFKKLFRLSRETFDDVCERFRRSSFYPNAGICNEDNRFLDVFIGFPGSVHDARVLRESPFFPEAAAKCGDGCYLLGDCAYPHPPWLLTPYKDNGQRFPQWKKRFNKCHSQQRVAIENTFGLLKQRFRRLYLVDAKTILQSCKIVLGACVLHNWCNAERDYLAEFVDLPDHEEVGNDEDDVDITTFHQ
ncbi:hypothetical protein MTO96_024738 [Rhipicephalus appendiculatus]